MMVLAAFPLAMLLLSEALEVSIRSDGAAETKQAPQLPQAYRVLGVPDDSRTYSSAYMNAEMFPVHSMLDSTRLVCIQCQMGWMPSGRNGIPGQWMQLDLGAEYMVGGVQIKSAIWKEFVTSCRIIGTNDPNDWDNAIVFGDAEGNATGARTFFPAPVEVRYVRFVVRVFGGNMCADVMVADVQPAVQVVQPAVPPAVEVVQPAVPPAVEVVQPAVQPAVEVVQPAVQPAVEVVQPAVQPDDGSDDEPAAEDSDDNDRARAGRASARRAGRAGKGSARRAGKGRKGRKAKGRKGK